MRFFDILKNIFFALLFLQITPGLIRSIATQFNSIIQPKTHVAIVPIKGVLYDSSSTTHLLRKYFKDSSIKAILLKIDCSGSASGTGETIYKELVALKASSEYEKKPVVALVENVCASGGYYIASAADYIVAPGTSLIGSIGVTFPSILFLQFKDFMEQYKIHYNPLQAGAFKLSMDPLNPNTPEQTAALQSILDDSYDTFTQDVAQQRHLSLAQKDSWANGRLFTGKQARDLGLIDEIGSSHHAIQAIKERALITTEIEWIRPPATSPFAQFLGATSTDDDDTTLFHSLVSSVCSILEQRYLMPHAAL